VDGGQLALTQSAGAQLDHRIGPAAVSMAVTCSMATIRSRRPADVRAAGSELTRAAAEVRTAASVGSPQRRGRSIPSTQPPPASVERLFYHLPR
jgi:hypothetical protein